jgi:hypothetical protein
MTTFDDRERASEGLYAHDLDLMFRVNCRRDKLLALWAAEQMGMGPAEAKAYVDRIVSIDCEKPRSGVYQAVSEDLRGKGVAVSEHRLQKQMNRLTRQAWTQVMNDDRLEVATI